METVQQALKGLMDQIHHQDGSGALKKAMMVLLVRMDMLVVKVETEALGSMPTNYTVYYFENLLIINSLVALEAMAVLEVLVVLVETVPVM